jgi:hypothetical protein
MARRASCTTSMSTMPAAIRTLPLADCSPSLRTPGPDPGVRPCDGRSRGTASPSRTGASRGKASTTRPSGAGHSRGAASAIRSPDARPVSYAGLYDPDIGRSGAPANCASPARVRTRCAWSLPAPARRRRGLTFPQPFAPNVAGLDGPCDPGNPSAPKTAGHRFLRSHGPTERKVRVIKVNLSLGSGRRFGRRAGSSAAERPRGAGGLAWPSTVSCHVAGATDQGAGATDQGLPVGVAVDCRSWSTSLPRQAGTNGTRMAIDRRSSPTALAQPGRD